MTVLQSEGILGLEARHEWNGWFNLNQLWTFPRAKLTRIGGIHSLPDADDTREPAGSRPGELIYPSYPRGKTITYEGSLQCFTQESLRTVRQAMKSVFQERNTEGRMRAIPHPDYGDVVWYFDARVISLDIDEKITADYTQLAGLGPVYERTFTLALRMSDGRYTLDGDELTSPSQANNAVYDVDYTGDAPSDPVFYATVVAGQDVELHNLSVIASNGVGARLRFADVPDSGLLTVDFRTRRADIDGVNVNYRLDRPWSTWWDELIPGLVPGLNQIQVKNVTNWSLAWRVRSV